MDKRHDTVLETVMEQLIEGGAENMGLVFARVFDLAMQIERERPASVSPSTQRTIASIFPSYSSSNRSIQSFRR